MQNALKIKDQTNASIILQIYPQPRTKARILMKFDVVVNLLTLSFKFHEDPCLDARTRVANARTREKSCARIYAQIFMKFET